MSGQRLVLDGRNEREGVHVIPLESFNVIGEWISLDSKRRMYCILLDHKYVPCVSVNDEEYDYILCGAYNTKAGFTKWRRRFFPNTLNRSSNIEEL